MRNVQAHVKEPRKGRSLCLVCFHQIAWNANHCILSDISTCRTLWCLGSGRPLQQSTHQNPDWYELKLCGVVCACDRPIGPCEDCGGRASLHPLTDKLGKLAPGNASRDWWRTLGRGPEAWPGIVLYVILTSQAFHIMFVIENTS